MYASLVKPKLPRRSTFATYAPSLFSVRSYSTIAFLNSAGEKSGQKISVKQSSVYSNCQSKNPDSLFSPPVLISKSGSGCPVVSSNLLNSSSVISDFLLNLFIALIISSRPPQLRAIFTVILVFFFFSVWGLGFHFGFSRPLIWTCGGMNIIVLFWREVPDSVSPLSPPN